MALAWINANDQNNQQNQINELNTHQDSICTSVRSKFNSNGFFNQLEVRKYADDKNTIYTTSIVFFVG